MSTRDYLYENRVVPFFKAKGEAVPPRSAMEAPGTVLPETPESKMGRFAVGTAKGLANSVTGMVKLPLELHDFSLKAIAKLTGQEEPKALTSITERAMAFADEGNNQVQNYLHDTYGESQTTGGHVSEEVGKMVGLLPSFITAGKILKGVPLLAQMAEGGAAVPIALKNLPNSVRAIAASSVLQKSLFNAIEGGLSAPMANDGSEAGAWAAFGAALPPAWLGLKKAITATVIKDGAYGVASSFKNAMDWASKAKATRPAPTNSSEALSAVIGNKLDEAASAIKEGKDFSEVPPATQEQVAAKVKTELQKLVADPDEETVSEIAGAEHETASQVSPLAKQTDDEISSIASQAGVPTTKEAVAKKAAKDVQRATITEKVKNAPVTETVPEADHTLQAQLDAVKGGDKRGMVLSKEQLKSLGEIPDNLTVQSFKDGQAVVFNDKAISVNKVKELKLKNRINEVVDYPVSKDEVAKAVANGENPVTITAKDAVTGAEKETVAASSSSAVETVEAVQKHFPKAEVSVGGPEDAAKAVKERLIQNIKHGAMNQVQAEAYGIMLNKQMEPSAKAIAEVNDAIKAWKEAGLPDAELQSLLREIEAKKIQVLDQARASAKASPIPETPAAAPKVEAPKSKEVPLELTKAREDAKAAAKDLANETNMINKVSIMERLNAALEKVKKLEAKHGVTDEPVAVAEPVSQIEKPTVKAAKKVKASEAPSDKNVASGLAVKIEIRKSGLAENEAYAILKKSGYTSTKDIPEGPEAEAILEEIRAAALKKTPFYRMDGNSDILTENPGSQASRDAGKVILKPSKVLNMDTGFDPVFARHVNEDFPSLNASPMAPQKAFQAVVEHLKGQDKDIGDWLKDKGYDLLHQDTPDGKIVEVLNKDVVKTIAIDKAQKMADAAVATGATSIEQARASVKAAKDVEAELTRLREEAIAKGEVTIQRFDANGKPVKEKWKPGPGAANEFDPAFGATRLWHASPQDFDSFDLNKSSETGMWGKAAYFFPEEPQANGVFTRGKKILEFALSKSANILGWESPLPAEFKGALINQVKKYAESRNWMPEPLSWEINYINKANSLKELDSIRGSGRGFLISNAAREAGIDGFQAEREFVVTNPSVVQRVRNVGIAHDTEGASPEELARGEINYKVDRSGKLTWLGAKIDAGTLKDNEAVVAIHKKTGKLRVVNSNFTMSDQSVIDRFGDIIKKAVK